MIQQRYARKVDIALLYERLSRGGLILKPRPKYVARGDIESMSLTLLKIDIRPCFRMIAGLARSVAPLLAGFLLQCFDSAYARDALRFMYRNGGVRTDIGLYYSLLFCSFFCHEIAHGVAATYFGLVPRRLCFGLYLGYLPMIYLRIGGTYTLPEWQRAVVWAAGIWWNFTFASACALMFSFSPETAHLIFVAIVANCWMGVVNLFPFLPTDGYYILLTLTKGVNIRSDAWRELGRWLHGKPGKFTTAPALFLVITMSTCLFMLFRSVRSIHSASDVRLWLTVLPIGFLVVRSLWRMFQNRQLNAAIRGGVA
jgi:Zn-dependent protease